MAIKLLEKLGLRIDSEEEEMFQSQIPAELRLLAAVIRHAVHEWLMYRRSPIAKQRMLAERARRWLFDDSEGFGTFITYCHLVNVDPGQIRIRISGIANGSSQVEVYAVTGQRTISS